MALTPPALDRDRFCTVEEVRPDPSGTALVRFSGIHGIGPVRDVVGCYVLAAKDDLDLGPFDVAYEDLLGREVVDARFGSLGSITEVMETPANDVWVVEGAYGEVLIPVVEAAVEPVPDGGAIRSHIMDGLIDLADDSKVDGRDAGPASGGDGAAGLDAARAGDGSAAASDEDAEVGVDATCGDAVDRGREDVGDGPEPGPGGRRAAAGKGEEGA